jgi:Ca-activated chloride channel family protein
VGTLNAALDHLREVWLEGASTRLANLHFVHAETARLGATMLLGIALAVILVRILTRRGAGSSRLGLPALLEWARPRRLTLVRHGALVCALAGLPFFALAFGDPKTPLTRQEITHPGRRISLMIDASSSMLSSMPSTRLAKGAPNDAAFFTTVGAARYFVEMRRNGEYRDLVALVEFGDQAYVITPFTTDYDNILLSMSLIGDWNEFMAFPDQGTIIANAIDQSVGLFEAFDFLDASGNAMVIFTDGMDAQVTEEGKSAFDVLSEADRAGIPVYFIRIGDPERQKKGVSDEAWAAAVARTGGRFYSAADEAAIMRVIQDINRSAPGRIDMRRYVTEQPKFTPYALAAVVLWTLAIAMRLTLPWFQTFP